MARELIPKRHTRRKFLAGLALMGLGGAAYARYGEPRWLDLSKHELRLRRGGPPRLLRLLHLSDFHASPEVSLAFIERAIRTGLRCEPDLICVTGDFITREFDEWDRYARTLSLLSAAAPTFGSLGNHDGGLWAAAIGGHKDVSQVRTLLTRSGIALLHNAAQSATVRDWKMQLVGLGDLWARDVSPDQAFAGLRPAADHVTIVLAHNPDTKEMLRAHPWDLMLSGHTHGGQFRMPLIGTPFAPVEDPRYVQGLHQWEGRWLHVTKGIGNVYGLRFNCRPEISLLTLT
jgi:predicted MPP superfamily phosphohydrolase